VGRSRTSWIDSAAAITSTSRTHRSPSAARIIRPNRGSIGRRASRRPTAVRVRSGRMAPSSTRRATASHGPGVGRVDEGERLDVAEAQGRHLQDDRGQVGAQDLGLGERRAGGVVVLVVEADADARRHPAAPPARWSADACLTGSIGRRCTFVRRL
jgi:hypothetical protein